MRGLFQFLGKAAPNMQAGLPNLGAKLWQGARYAAKVPQGQKFFSSPGNVARQSLRLGFNPNLGRANWAKHGINAYVMQDLARDIYSNYTDWAQPILNSRPAQIARQNLEPSLNWKLPFGLAGELMNIDAIPQMDKIPRDGRNWLRAQGRGLATAGLQSALTDFSQLHADRWAGDKWPEPFKVVASPLSKPLAGLFAPSQSKRYHLPTQLARYESNRTP